MSVEYKQLKFEIKMSAEEGVFEGYAAFKGNVDSYGDILQDGSMRRTLRNTKNFPVFFNHDPSKPVGISLSAKEDKNGLFVKTLIDLSTDLGKMVYSGLKMGYLKSMSIGYQVIKDEMNKKGNRLLQEIKLLEYSVLPIGFGANELAMVSAVKNRSLEPDTPERIKEFEYEIEQKILDLQESIEELKEQNIELKEQLADSLTSTRPLLDPQDPSEDTLEVKTVSGSASLPIAGRDVKWDASKARSELFENMSTAKNGFFWYEDPETKGGYKLPFAYMENGKMTAIPSGIFAVAGVLQGGMGGVDIPQEAQNSIKKKVSTYYARMREKFNDPDLIPPWDKKENSNDEKPKSIDSEAFLNAFINFAKEVKENESRNS